MSKQSRKTIQLLLVALDNPDEVVGALEKIESMGKAARKYYRYVLPFLRDREGLVRSTTIEALMGIEAHAAVPEIVKCLRDRDYVVRLCAVEALGDLASRDYYKVLLQMLHDKHWMVRGYAAESLVKLNSIRGKEDVIKALKAERSSWTKIRMYETLYALEKKKNYITDQLVRFLKSRSILVRRACGMALAAIINSTNAMTIRSAVQQALFREAHPVVASELQKLKNKSNTYVHS